MTTRSASADWLFEGRRIKVVVGHYGSGKTEIAVNMALTLASRAPAMLIDLDIVNPFFRSAEVKPVLESRGVEVIHPTYALTGVDIPILPAEVERAFTTERFSVFDVGGDDDGAAALGRYCARFVACPADVYFAITAAEEIGCSGGRYIARTLPVETMIAIEIAPVAPEYEVVMSPAPVINYKDRFVYHKGLSDRLCAIGDDLGFGHQRSLFRTMGTDAGEAYRSGQIARAACLCFPTENTHGYEMAHFGAILNTGRMLGAYAANPKL